MEGGNIYAGDQFLFTNAIAQGIRKGKKVDFLKTMTYRYGDNIPTGVNIPMGVYEKKVHDMLISDPNLYEYSVTPKG